MGTVLQFLCSYQSNIVLRKHVSIFGIERPLEDVLNEVTTDVAHICFPTLMVTNYYE
jgi:hypothetical protein